MNPGRVNSGVKPMIESFETNLFNSMKREFEADGTLPVPSLMCIGVGGGGCNIVSELNRQKDSVKMFCLNTDQISNTKRNDVNPMTVGMEYIGDNRDSGGFVEVAKKSFKEDSPLIAVRVLKGADLVILVATLGGGTGSGGSMELVKLLKEEKVPFYIFVVRPFEFEDRRKEVADKTIEELRRETPHLKIFDNNEYDSIKEVNRALTEEIDKFVDLKTHELSDIYEKGFNQFVTEVLTERTLMIDIDVFEDSIFNKK